MMHLKWSGPGPTRLYECEHYRVDAPTTSCCEEQHKQKCNDITQIMPPYWAFAMLLLTIRDWFGFEQRKCAQHKQKEEK